MLVFYILTFARKQNENVVDFCEEVYLAKIVSAWINKENRKKEMLSLTEMADSNMARLTFDKGNTSRNGSSIYGRTHFHYDTFLYP